MLLYLRGTPVWGPENSVNIWNLLWLPRRLIVSTENTNISISTFLWRIGDQEQAQAVADHFTSSAVSIRKTRYHLVAFHD